MSSPRPLRVVLDTNVIVAALLHPGRTPDRVIERLFAEGGRVLLDPRIEQEYREVLARRKFASIAVERREALLARVLRASEPTLPVHFDGELPDADDRMFVEVALGGRADAIVTGNGRDFPGIYRFAVLAPAEWLARMEGPS